MARHLIPSDKTIRAIKPGDERQRLSDGDGLYLQLFVKGGSHGWRFAYSYAGRRNILSLGTYPDTGLALARTKAGRSKVAEWLKYLENGSAKSRETGDPMATFDFTWMWQELGMADLRK